MKNIEILKEMVMKFTIVKFPYGQFASRNNLGT